MRVLYRLFFVIVWSFWHAFCVVIHVYMLI